MTKFSAHNEASDHLLVKRVAEGDKQAFEKLLERHQSVIYRYCTLMVGDGVIVDDMFQDTFFSFYRICREGRDIQNVRGYLLVTARSRCLDYLQAKQHYVPLEDAYELQWEQDLTSLDVQEHLREALLLIPAQYREAFVLFALKEYSYEEIATTLEISRHVVKNRIYRAKQSLQKILSPILYDSNETD